MRHFDPLDPAKLDLFDPLHFDPLDPAKLDPAQFSKQKESI